MPCPGDVNGDGHVGVDELVGGLNCALDLRSTTDCSFFDGDGNGNVDVHELIESIHLALKGCPIPTALPTGTPTATDTPMRETPSPRGARSGLIIVQEEQIPNSPFGSTPHLFDVLIEDKLYLANSNDGVVAYDVSGDGLLSLAFDYAALHQELIRCTSVAVHQPSRRLYCAAVDVSEVVVLDADTGDLLSRGNLRSGWARGYRDLHVVGDTLYLAAFDAGLLRASIGEDGSLRPLEPYLDGDIVGVEGDHARLLVLDRVKGLRILEKGVDVATVALAGPPLRISAHEGVAVVALGSRGVVVIDAVTATPLLEAHPPCVAVDADYRDGALAIACTAGLYLYETQPRLRTAGWVPAVYASLGARFSGNFLVGNDWRIVTTYRVDVTGRALGLDAPRGFLLEEGQGIRFTVRNPDDQAQRFAGRVLPPLGELTIEVPPSTGDELLVLATEEQDESTNVEVRIARGRPRVTFGSPFPVPLATRYVSFIQPDCALQFPAIEDLDWLAANDLSPGGLQPLVLLVLFNDQELPVDAFLRLWGQTLEAERLVDVLPIAATSLEVFDARFSATDYLGGADTTVEFSVDEAGRIVGFDRVYRGAYPLPATVW